jgi:hypothetical protein
MADTAHLRNALDQQVWRIVHGGEWYPHDGGPILALTEALSGLVEPATSLLDLSGLTDDEIDHLIGLCAAVAEEYPVWPRIVPTLFNPRSLPARPTTADIPEHFLRGSHHR